MAQPIDLAYNPTRIQNSKFETPPVHDLSQNESRAQIIHFLNHKTAPAKFELKMAIDIS